MLQAAGLTIRLHPEDDVVIARVEIPTGTLLTLLLETAWGRKSKSEELGYGEDEFVPWVLGATM